jgi:acyl-CoA thioester hydrolase
VEDETMNGNTKIIHFEMPLLINTYDIDIAGHVNNIVYIRWLEDLRTRLFSKIFNFKEVLQSGFYFVVISTTIKYKKQLKLFDTPTGTIKINDLKHGILSLSIQIKNADQICAVADQRCVLMNMQKGKMHNEIYKYFKTKIENSKL